MGYFSSILRPGRPAAPAGRRRTLGQAGQARVRGRSASGCPRSPQPSAGTRPSKRSAGGLVDRRGRQRTSPALERRRARRPLPGLPGADGGGAEHQVRPPALGRPAAARPPAASRTPRAASGRSWSRQRLVPGGLGVAEQVQGVVGHARSLGRWRECRSDQCAVTRATTAVLAAGPRLRSMPTASDRRQRRAPPPCGAVLLMVLSRPRGGRAAGGADPPMNCRPSPICHGRRDSPHPSGSALGEPGDLTASPGRIGQSGNAATPGGPATPGGTTSTQRQRRTRCPARRVTPIRVERSTVEPRRTTEVVTVVSDGRNLTPGTREQTAFEAAGADRAGRRHHDRPRRRP